MSPAPPPTWTTEPREPSPADSTTAEPSLLRPLLVMAAIGSAVIHFAFAPPHLDLAVSHGAFFLTVAWLQVAWALAVARRPSTLTYRLVLNAAVIAVWLVSRTIGIDGDKEAIGFPDSVATALEAFVVLGSFGPLARLLPTRPVRDLTAERCWGRRPC